MNFAHVRTMRTATRTVSIAVLLALAAAHTHSAPGVRLRPARRVAHTRMLVEYGPEIHPEQLYAFGAVTGMTAVGYQIWEKVLVPQKRLELSRSKRGGEVKQLLDEIQDAPSERALERWFFSDWLEARNGTQVKKSAVPFLPKSKFNSGDNPVIGAVAAIMVIGILSSSLKQAVHLLTS